MPPKQLSIQGSAPCPCGSAKSLEQCCLVYIEGRQPAPSAEALMRSRYTAHCLLAVDYLWQTWCPERRSRSSKADILAWAESCTWLGLEILNTHQGTPMDHQGSVEFIAHYSQAGKGYQHHELSLFRKDRGQWYYLDHLG